MVTDLPDLWNKKYEDYLGIIPQDAAEGILQDIHWAMANFGYFPSYAIGSAIAAQLYHHMVQQMPLNDYLTDGNLIPVRSTASGCPAAVFSVFRTACGRVFCSAEVIPVPVENFPGTSAGETFFFPGTAVFLSCSGAGDFPPWRQSRIHANCRISLTRIRKRVFFLRKKFTKSVLCGNASAVSLWCCSLP